MGLPKDRGEIVSRSEPGYAAARAGIRQGDVIVRVNNVDVSPDSTLSYIVANLPVGSRVPIELIRGGKRQTVTATVGERPPEDQLAAITGGDDGDDDDNALGDASPNVQGLSLQSLTPPIAKQLGIAPTVRGVVVSAVDPSSDAAANGMQRGDVILSINQRPTLTAADVAAAVDEARKAGRNSVLLLWQRGTRPAIYVGIKLAPGK